MEESETKNEESKAVESKASAKSQGSGLEPNIAAMLCWIFAPISSIVFLMIDKDNKLVKFHALQSMVFTIGGFLIATVLATIMTFTIILSCCAWIPYLYFIVNIYGAIKAYNNEMWKLPVIGDWAEKQVK